MVQTIVPTDEELAARRLVFRYNTRTDTYIRGEHTGHPAKSKGFETMAADVKSIACYSAQESAAYDCTACLYSWEDGHISWIFEHPSWQIRGAHLSVPYKTEGGSMKITVLVDEREVELVQNNEEENEERCAKFDVFAEGKRLTVKAEMRGRAMLCPQLNDEDPCGDLYVSIKFDV